MFTSIYQNAYFDKSKRNYIEDMVRYKYWGNIR